MMLISILLILHVQRDRYIEALRWHGGIADHGPPLPWEVQPIILPNDTYEAASTSARVLGCFWKFWEVGAHFISFSPFSAHFVLFQLGSSRFLSLDLG